MLLFNDFSDFNEKAKRVLSRFVAAEVAEERTRLDARRIELVADRDAAIAACEKKSAPLLKRYEKKVEEVASLRKQLDAVEAERRALYFEMAGLSGARERIVAACEWELSTTYDPRIDDFIIELAAEYQRERHTLRPTYTTGTRNILTDKMVPGTSNSDEVQARLAAYNPARLQAMALKLKACTDLPAEFAAIRATIPVVTLSPVFEPTPLTRDPFQDDDEVPAPRRSFDPIERLAQHTRDLDEIRREQGLGGP